MAKWPAASSYPATVGEYPLAPKVYPSTGMASFPSGVPPYVAPTVPVLAKCDAFYWADDIVDPASWPARFDRASYGALTGINTTLEATGWVTPEGNLPAMRCTRASSSALRNDNFAASASGDDNALEFVVWYQNVSVLNPTVLVCWGNNASSTPKRELLYTTGPLRWQQQATALVFGHNATNLLQQMVRVRQVNNGAGTDTTIWRNEELDPIDGTGTLTQNLGSQSINSFLIGANQNGASLANFADIRVRGFWFRTPGAAPLTAAEGLELSNFGYGALAQAPFYSGATAHRRFYFIGQSNTPGIATDGSPPGLPDTNVRFWPRSINNWIKDPAALESLQLQTGGQHGTWAYFTSDKSPTPHHVCLIGKGATSVGNWADTTNSLQGMYATALDSEMRRGIQVFQPRVGGTPRNTIVWWQWENDATSGAAAAAYEANFRLVVARLRFLIGAGTPIHVVMPNPNVTGGGVTVPNINTIRAAFTTIAGDTAGIYLIETNDLDLATYYDGTNLHCNDLGYHTIANRQLTSIQAEP